MQTYLKENKINLMLKYDSPRETKKYTLLVFNLEKNEVLYGGDVDSTGDRLSEISMLDNEIPIAEIRISLYKLFKIVENSIKDIDGVVFILSTKYVINEDTIDYTLSISSQKNSERFIFNSYSKLKEFIEENYE